MSPLLKNLLGNGSKDRELAEEMRAVLHELRQERERCEAVVHGVHASTERLQQLGEPIARAASDADAVASRIASLELRFAALAPLTSQLQTLDERATGLAEDQRAAGAQIATVLEEAKQTRSTFEEIGQRIDLALALKDRLGTFLEVEKPFEQVRGDVEALRGQVAGTGEQLSRLREQHDRLLDAHKLATSKVEALDRRREELSRDLQDKERRVAGVEQAVRGMDGVQQTVDGVKREIGTLKALGDSVAQKTAALEAQRESVERALSQADHLERAMRQIDTGVRQQQENEKTLGALRDQVAALRSLHEAVLERSGEITQFQRETDDQTRATREDLAAMTDEMKKTVERFDFESRGLESVSQRVADLRGALSDCENRFKGLSESNLALAELGSQAKALASHLRGLTDEVGQVDQEIGTFRAIRRELDETQRTAREAGERIARIEQARPAAEAGLRDLEQLRGAHAMVKDALEQAQLAHAEIVRTREHQSETRTWLSGVEQSATELRGRVDDMIKLAPAIEVAQQRALRLGETMTAIESRSESVEELNRRMVAVGAMGGKLEERGRQLEAHMEAAERRFAGLAASSQEAERLCGTVATVSSGMIESERRSEEVGRLVAAIAARCESVEQLAEQTRALRPELEQRHQALTEATRDLQRASALRKEGAASAQKLDDLAGRLTGALSAAEQRMTQVQELSAQLEDRTADLQSVELRLGRFEERLTRWDPVEKEVARSLEQISARLGTVQAIEADLDRMIAMTEQTTANVREITSAHQEVEEGRKLLADVMTRLGEVRDTASALDERRRQMTRAEERLARAEAVLVEVRSSLEALQRQKAIVEQAVEKAGSLQSLLKQADTTIEGLREERELSSRVRAAVAIVRRDDDEDEGGDEAKAA